jgi:hypothetical protein
MSKQNVVSSKAGLELLTCKGYSMSSELLSRPLISLERPASRVAWLFLAFALAGCGGPKLYPVTGKVVYADGSPMKGGAVMFESTGPKRFMAQGVIDVADGTFFLTTKEEGDGAEEGVYRVAIRGRRNNPHGREDDPELENQLHPRFQSFDTSKLEFTVAPKPNEFVIKVERAPKPKSSVLQRPQ